MPTAGTTEALTTPPIEGDERTHRIQALLQQVAVQGRGLVGHPEQEHKIHAVQAVVRVEGACAGRAHANHHPAFFSARLERVSHQGKQDRLQCAPFKADVQGVRRHHAGYVYRFLHHLVGTVRPLPDDVAGVEHFRVGSGTHRNLHEVARVEQSARSRRDDPVQGFILVPEVCRFLQLLDVAEDLRPDIVEIVRQLPEQVHGRIVDAIPIRRMPLVLFVFFRGHEPILPWIPIPNAGAQPILHKCVYMRHIEIFLHDGCWQDVGHDRRINGSSAPCGLGPHGRGPFPLG